MPAGTVIEEARGLLSQRLGELADEQKQVERALAELGGGPAKRSPGRPRGSATKPGKPRKRRTGTRADQAVALIEKEPGIGAKDVAKQMKIKPNYLYRVLGDLEKEGRVRKDGLKYFPTS